MGHRVAKLARKRSWPLSWPLTADFQEKAVYRDGDRAVQHAELTLSTGLIMLGQYSDEGWMGGQ
jgi:hypothetical protein